MTSLSHPGVLRLEKENISLPRCSDLLNETNTSDVQAAVTWGKPDKTQSYGRICLILERAELRLFLAYEVFRNYSQ